MVLDCHGDGIISSENVIARVPRMYDYDMSQRSVRVHRIYFAGSE